MQNNPRMGPRAPFKLKTELKFQPELCCKCVSLQSCLLLLQAGPVLSPFIQSALWPISCCTLVDLSPGPNSSLAVSVAVNGPCY